MGPVAGADRKRMHELRLDLAGLARFPSKGLPRPGSRTEVNYARSTQPYASRDYYYPDQDDGTGL
jgi:hypothetical protein